MAILTCTGASLPRSDASRNSAFRLPTSDDQVDASGARLQTVTFPDQMSNSLVVSPIEMVITATRLRSRCCDSILLREPIHAASSAEPEEAARPSTGQFRVTDPDDKSRGRPRLFDAPRRPAVPDRAIDAWLRTSLRAAYGNVVDEPIPHDLLELIKRYPQQD